MKLLCVGDLHLGAGSDYGREPGERLAEQAKVLERIVEIREEYDCDFTLFAGDAFERRRPTPAELLAFSDGMMDLKDYGDVVAIVGNHDVEAFDRPSGMEVFGWLDVARTPDVWTSWAHRVEGHEKYDHAKLAVARLPWTPVSNLVARAGGGDRDEINARAADLLIDTARDLRAQMPTGGPKILLLHWSVSGSSLPSGLPVDQLREPVLPLPDLEELGFDAIVMGHIHKPQGISQQQPIFYVGSPMPLNFGEASVAHGVTILEFDGPLVTPTFVPVESRPFVTLDADITGQHPTSGLAYVDLGYAEKEQPVDGAIVKVRYRATADQARRVDHQAIRQALLDAGAHKVYAIQADIVREQRARVAGVDESIDELAALDLYCEANLDRIQSAQAKAMRDRTSGYLEAIR